MSHLVPNFPADHELAGRSKPIREYSADERASALLQVNDAANMRTAQGKPIDKGTATLIADLAKGTDKEDTLSKEVLEAATAPARGK